MILIPGTVESIRTKRYTMSVDESRVYFNKELSNLLEFPHNKIAFHLEQDPLGLRLSIADDGYLVRYGHHVHNISNRPLCREILEHFNAQKLRFDIHPEKDGILTTIRTEQKPMNTEAFIEKVKAMREAQKLYFRTRSANAKAEAIALEKEVDKLIASKNQLPLPILQ